MESVEVVQLLGEIKDLLIYAIASNVACFAMLMLSQYAKGWKA